MSFEKLIALAEAGTLPPANQTIAADFSAGKQIETGDPYDLAIRGDGFFVVRSGDQVFYTRQGQFERRTDGRLTTPQGMALQTEEGADLVLTGSLFKVLEDGTVLEGGAPVARLALVEVENRSRMKLVGGSLFTTADEEVRKADASSVRQGALEASNVSTADEMVTIMGALRRAESAQRLVNVYDDLMGRTLTTFGQG